MSQSLASAVDFDLWVICSTSGNTVSWLISNMLIRDTMSLSETCEETTEHKIIDQLAYFIFYLLSSMTFFNCSAKILRLTVKLKIVHLK